MARHDVFGKSPYGCPIPWPIVCLLVDIPYHYNVAIATLKHRFFPPKSLKKYIYSAKDVFKVVNQVVGLLTKESTFNNLNCHTGVFLT